MITLPMEANGWKRNPFYTFFTHAKQIQQIQVDKWKQHLQVKGVTQFFAFVS